VGLYTAFVVEPQLVHGAAPEWTSRGYAENHYNNSKKKRCNYHVDWVVISAHRFRMKCYRIVLHSISTFCRHEAIVFIVNKQS